MKENTDRRAIGAVLLCLLLAALACGPTETTTLMPFPTAAGQMSTAPTDTPLPATSPTDTPASTVQSASGCTFDSAWVADVTVPDDTEFPPGGSFIKTWRITNSGTCDWEDNTMLVFISGDHMNGPVEVLMGDLPTGANADISVTQVAPAAPGTYKGNWQLERPDGTRFGAVFYVQIVVPGPATDTPPPPPPTDTPEPSSSCGVAPNAALKPVLDQAEALGFNMGCPTAPAFNVQTNGHTGAFQEFWTTGGNRSLMIWRSDNRDIYVIDGDDADASTGSLLAYTDTWEEGQPTTHPDCAAMTPPAGHLMPVRGFGKVWCTEDLEDEVGWPADPETQANLLVQTMEVGMLIKVTGPMPIHYLVALGNGWAVTMMISP